MAKKSSLLEYLQIEISELTKEPVVTANASELEKAVVSTYKPLHEAVKDSHKTGIFEIYLDAKDIDRDQVRRYSAGLEKLQRAPFKVKESSWLRKLAHRTSEWRKEKSRETEKRNKERRYWYPHGEYIYSDVELSDILNVLGGLGGFITTLVGVTTNTPEAIYVGSSLLTSAAAYAGLVWKKTDLKPVEHKFEPDQARNYLLELRRFHLLAQQMEREVEDIDRLDHEQKYDFVMKYGKIRMNREKAVTTGLTKDEIVTRTLQYGAREVAEQINKAKTEVRTVRESVETVLKAANVEIIELSESYVPAGIKWYDEHIGVVDRVDEELKKAIEEPHRRAEELRKRLAEDKFKG